MILMINKKSKKDNFNSSTKADDLDENTWKVEMLEYFKEDVLMPKGLGRAISDSSLPMKIDDIMLTRQEQLYCIICIEVSFGKKEEGEQPGFL